MEQFHRKAVHVLRENIRSLLAGRKEDQVTLARWCGHEKSWINKFLNEGRGLRIPDLDGIASFFGIDPYQLFQPGISSLTERRISGDRRIGADRRIGHAGRQLASLRTELDKLPRTQGAAHGVASSTRLPAADPIQRILARAERDIAAVYAGQQAPTARPRRAKLPRGDRKIRGSGTDPD